ncbi:hypothetical protein MuYL_1420 [Mucilaginibacter xinganensis]|uniref:Uncharacterized protein n=1 Tax=Mucilaginibacter xinganensis TaxID=1234841 RepID=A0A223NUL1_9SPHI|nr:hypothetical protein MuYL_1420 [Mucilaginibacter xinganensis]
MIIGNTLQRLKRFQLGPSESYGRHKNSYLMQKAGLNSKTAFYDID